MNTLVKPLLALVFALSFGVGCKKCVQCAYSFKATGNQIEYANSGEICGNKSERAAVKAQWAEFADAAGSTDLLCLEK